MVACWCAIFSQYRNAIFRFNPCTIEWTNLRYTLHIRFQQERFAQFNCTFVVWSCLTQRECMICIYISGNWMTSYIFILAVYVKICQELRIQNKAFSHISSLRFNTVVLHCHQVFQCVTVIYNIEVFIVAIYLVDTFYKAQTSIAIVFIQVCIMHHVVVCRRNRVFQVNKEPTGCITVVFFKMNFAIIFCFIFQFPVTVESGWVVANVSVRNWVYTHTKQITLHVRIVFNNFVHI